MKYIISERQFRLIEGLHDTSWENNQGDKISLIDLLDATEKIPVQSVPLDWIKPHLLSWEGDDEEVKKIEGADLKYPILIFVNDDGKFVSIIDGHHRAQKALRHGLDEIKGKIIPISTLPKNIKKVFSHLLSETANEEAWELVGQKHPVIKNLVSSKGFKNDEDSVKKLEPIIDSLPEKKFSYEEIKDFQNLENKKGDIGLLKKMHEISSSKNPRKRYKDFMDKRDEGENRKRGYDPVKNFDRIVKDSYESPVVLKVNGTHYVVGGRTRIYAAVAAGKPIRIKILTPRDLKKGK